MMKNETKTILKFLWAIFMLAIYFGMAFMLVFTDFFNFNGKLGTFLGVCFFLYGLYRAYRIITYK
ncbi:MAG: hypothetical protein RR356_04935 [Bacteroidales bacterium]